MPPPTHRLAHLDALRAHLAACEGDAPSFTATVMLAELAQAIASPARDEAVAALAAEFRRRFAWRMKVFPPRVTVLRT